MINPIKKQLKNILLRSVLAVAALLVCSSAIAYTQQKTVLIINAHNEEEPWGIRMTMPLINHMMLVDSVVCKTAYFTNFLIDDSVKYNQMADNLFEQYRNNPPTCVLMVGNFVFNLRDRIKQEWGNIPFTIISRIEGFGPLDDYFASNTPHAAIEQRQPMSSLRLDYNFTAVLVPDYPKATVDLMNNLIPEMDSLIFMSDASYVNRVASYNIYNYLLEEYPNVKYKWLLADAENSEDVRMNLAFKRPHTGYLMSSWAYATTSLLEYPMITTKDLSYVSAAVNPVFTLRYAYLNLGCLGGVFSDNDVVSEVILQRTEAMLRGEDMREIPFYYPDKNEVVINYRLLKKYDLDESKCPSDTHFYSKTPSAWQKFWLPVTLVTAFLIVVLLLLGMRNRMQRHQIKTLRRHHTFIDTMPMPYCQLRILLNQNDRLVDVQFVGKNQAYEKLIKENSLPQEPEHLLPSKLMAKHTRELLDGKKTISFTYYLECTQTYYEFMMYLMNTTERAEGIKEVLVDMFARNITESHKMQMSLQRTSEFLEMAIQIVKIVPWHLDWKDKEIVVDLQPKSLEQYTSQDHAARISFSDYLKMIVEEDRHILDEAYIELNNGDKEDFDLQYRIHRRDDPNKVDWIRNRFKIVEKSENGSVARLLGTMQIITKTKEHEQLLTSALNKARESDMMKSVFLANMSHEIRTPLNAIIGLSSSLASMTDEDDKQEVVDVITYNNELLLTLINDIMDLSRIEGNAMEINPMPTDVEEILDKASKTISVKVPHGVKLNVVHYADSLPAMADPMRLSQILINLLSNACKFTRKGLISMGVELRESENQLYFYVKDTGLGISQENQAKIFERFVKLNQHAQGVGLGLTISQAIVNKMGGTMGVYSEGEGRGSLFWFTIPYQTPQQNASQQKEENV